MDFASARSLSREVDMEDRSQPLNDGSHDLLPVLPPLGTLHEDPEMKRPDQTHTTVILSSYKKLPDISAAQDCMNIISGTEKNTSNIAQIPCPEEIEAYLKRKGIMRFFRELSELMLLDLATPVYDVMLQRLDEHKPQDLL
eukprot:m.78001 g.78001  ORF g.78001 m.78001 type:complete len:141 (+) comp16207_c0_seq1:242-664(+)